MKRILKFGILFVVLGICAVYTYGFITGDVTSIQTEGDKAEEQTEEEQTEEEQTEVDGSDDDSEIAVYQTPSPQIMKTIEDGWERIKYAYLPNLPDLEWTEMNEEYLLVLQNVLYKVVGGSIGKQWNPDWNYDILKNDYEDHDLDKKHNLKGRESYVSVHLQMENKGNSTCVCCLENNSVRIYNEKGKNLVNGHLCTMSIDKPCYPTSRKTWYEKLKPGGKLDVELVYTVKDKYLADTNYYFYDVMPGGSYPPDTDWVGIFKLPFGVERGNQNDKK